MALKVKFELALHQHNEGYDTDNIYDLSQLLKKATNILVVAITNKGSIYSSGSQGGEASTHPLTPTRRAVEPLFHRWAHKYLNFNDMPPTIMECYYQDKEEEYFPTAPLDDEVWLKEPIPERDLHIRMATRRPETNYTSWTTLNPWEYAPEWTVAYSQEYIPEQAVAYPWKYIPKLAVTYPQEYLPMQAAANPEEPTSEAITWDEVLSSAHLPTRIHP